MEKTSYSIVQRNKRRGIMTWYLRVKKPDEAHPHFYSLGTTRKVEATMLMAEKVKSGEYEKSERERLIYRDAIDSFMGFCEQNHIKKGTMKNYKNALTFLDRFLCDSVLNVKSQQIVDAFIETNCEKANKTFNLKKCICSRFFKYLSDNLDLNMKNPFRMIRPRKGLPKYKKSFWTLEQISAILDHASSPKERLLWSFMAYAGLRIFEARKLKREDVFDGKVHVLGKGDKAATVPVSKLLQREIDRYSGDWDFSCITSYMGTLTRAVKLAGVEDDAGCNFHRFRHSFGSNLIRAGANVKAVQLLMRHSNIQTTLNIYAHMLDGDLEDSINLLQEKK